MTVKYVGESFGVDGLTDGKEYKCLAIEGAMLRIVDDSGEDYLYSALNPRPIAGSSAGGKWLVMQDDLAGSLSKLLQTIQSA